MSTKQTGASQCIIIICSLALTNYTFENINVIKAKTSTLMILILEKKKVS